MANVKNTICNSINDILKKNTNKNIEIEARFKPLDYKNYLRILSSLSEYKSEKFISKDLFYEVKTSFGKTIQERDTYYNDSVKTIKKQKIKYFEMEYEYKIVVSLEEEMSPKDRTSALLSTTRDKERTRFYFFGREIFVDVTRITSQSLNQAPIDIYEIEIEINNENLNFKNSCNYFFQTIDQILKIIQDTFEIYTISEKLDLISKYNSLLNLPGKEELNYNGIVTARNLKKRDCVYGGLIGGKYSYTITPKAEGHRKQLVILDSGIWMVYPPLEISLLIRNDDKIPDFVKLFNFFKSNNLINSIFDGENIAKERRINNGIDITSKYLYLVFDTMVLNNSIKVQDFPHSQRLRLSSFLHKVFLKNTNPIIRVLEKPFWELGNTYESFYNTLQNFKENTKNLEYLTDGAMFTPEEEKYKIDTSSNIFNRKLETHPDICKLKNWDQLTIDMQVIINPNIKLLVTRKTTEYKLVEFTGNYDKFSEDNIDVQSLLSFGIKNNDIVEFAPKKVGDLILLYPIRIRTDKIKPNSEYVASDVWNDINKPLTIETLEGKDFALIRQYHNKIKRNLFLDIFEGTDLIDIGYGNGGDLDKQNHFHKILGIEPDEMHIEESERRYKKNIEKLEEKYKKYKDKKILQEKEIYENKLKILKAGGEDSDTIVKAAIKHFKWKKDFEKEIPLKPLCISMMLSLSFFWQSQEKLESLLETIKTIKKKYKKYGGTENIEFIFFTIEKKRTLKIIKKKGDVFDLGPAHFEFEKPNILKVDIKNTIVKDQIEYLVNLKDLKFLENLEIHEADEEKFLSPDEMEYTSMYVYGSGIVKV